MTRTMQARLGAMLFLEYLIWGAWYVTLGTFLAAGLHLDGRQIGIAAGTTAVGAIFSPFFIGLIADRLFATQKVLATLHALGAVLLFDASRQLSFTSMYVTLLLYCLCFMPTLALTNSLAFRQMQNPAKEFGFIRVLGTLGWIVAGLIVGSLHIEATSRPLQIAALCSLLFAVYSLSLPDTPPLGRATAKPGLASLFPTEALALLKERSMLIFAFASFAICIPLQFYYAFTNLYLNQAGVANAAGKMTAGQMSELGCMLILPWFFRRLGVKYMLVAGMAAWALRYLAFAYGNAGQGMELLWLGIVLHGICYDFFFVTGQIFIDQKARADLRSAAQGLITLITYGLGMFVGSALSGVVVQHYSSVNATGAISYDWRSIWIFCALFSSAVLVAFLFTFKQGPRRHADEAVTSTNTGAPAEMPA